ncbi:MAG: helix-turn-helix transcriptional regulator [Patescibacteria group bacterium]
MRNKIREYRTKRGLTQQKLSYAVGVRRETIVFLEQFKYSPSLRLAHKIARVFKVGIDDLFTF